MFPNSCIYKKDYLIKYFLAFGLKIEQLHIIKSFKEIEGLNFTHLFLDGVYYDREKIDKITNQNRIILAIMKNDISKEIESVSRNIKVLNTIYTTNDLFNIFECSYSKKVEYSKRYVGRRVLIVDSNQVNIEFLKEALWAFGIKSDWIDEGEKAIEIYKSSILSSNPYDMILIEDRLTDMEGSELTKLMLQIKKKHNLKHIPIVGFSDNNFKNQESKAKIVGMDEFLIKPIKISDLDMIFKKYFKGLGVFA